MTVPNRPFGRSVSAGLLLLLLIGARGDGCTFSIGPNGLCASLRLEPSDRTLRVGEGFRVRINADGCTSAVACPCAESAAVNAAWRSDRPETATVDATGFVLAQLPGTTDIVIVPEPGRPWRRTRVRVTVLP
jgi:hypothetical protein